MDDKNALTPKKEPSLERGRKNKLPKLRVKASRTAKVKGKGNGLGDNSAGKRGQEMRG